MDRKLASIAIAVACLMAGCGSTTPTAPPASPAVSPIAQVQASRPIVTGVQAPPRSGDPAPAASGAAEPSPTPDPIAVRTAAAVGFQAAGVANLQARNALPEHHREVGRGPAALWGRYAAALAQLQVPDDVASDVHDLILKVTRFQAFLAAKGGSDLRLYRSDARYQTHFYKLAGEVEGVAARVRTELGLPAGGGRVHGETTLTSYP